MENSGKPGEAPPKNRNQRRKKRLAGVKTGQEIASLWSVESRCEFIRKPSAIGNAFVIVGAGHHSGSLNGELISNSHYWFGGLCPPDQPLQYRRLQDLRLTEASSWCSAHRPLSFTDRSRWDTAGK